MDTYVNDGMIMTLITNPAHSPKFEAVLSRQEVFN